MDRVDPVPEEPKQLPNTENEFAQLILEIYHRKELIANLERRHAERLSEYMALKGGTLPGGEPWDFDSFLEVKERVAVLLGELDALRDAINAAKQEVEERRTLLASLFWPDCMSSPPVKVKNWVIKVIGGRLRITTMEEYEHGEPEWL